MQRQEACSAVSIASPHKPLLVAKRVLRKLEDTEWLSLGKQLWGSTTNRQCSSETRLIHDPQQSCFFSFGISQESFMTFSKEVWSILPSPCAPCLSQLSNTSLPLLLQESVAFPAMSAFPKYFITLRNTHSLTTVEIREPLRSSGNPTL